MVCPICREELSPDGLPWICSGCRADIGKEMEGKLVDHRKECDEFPLVPFFTRFDYMDGAGEVIRQVKYKGRKELIDIIAPPAAELAGKLKERYDLDLLIPVPLHPRKERERGFNQSALMAEGIAAEADLWLSIKALERRKYTRQQTRLKGNKRLANVSGAFTVRDVDSVAGKRILLLDDVITTGATAAHCVYALWEAGAEMVIVLGVAGADG